MRLVPCKAVFEYQEPDRSVGITGGFFLVGFEFPGDMMDGRAGDAFVEVNLEDAQVNEKPAVLYTLDAHALHEVEETLERERLDRLQDERAEARAAREEDDV